MLEKDNNISTTFHKTIEMISKQETIITEAEIIKDSLIDSMVRYVRELPIPYNGEMLEAAWKQQNGKKKADRPMYEFIKKDLITILFSGRKVKLDSIVTSGMYVPWAYNFFFICEGVEFAVKIPNVNEINRNNIKRTSYGSYTLAYTSTPSIYSYITKSYNLKDIAAAIDEFLNNREKEVKEMCE